MDRYLCIHGHFYQPPRENPWLETVEAQDSAAPYHDWNERVTAECYAPNAAARILDADGRIQAIVNNYARISFNFGPTLLAWLERSAPQVYRLVLEADRESRERFSGHGSALAQAYNHLILPLANSRDKRTQVRWGVRDFEHRFGRRPEGMWLPETAVDLESLELLAEHGLCFTLLAPHQARRVRRIGGRSWREVGGGQIDPTRPYRVQLPSGRRLAVFFYDGPISRAVAFEGLLSNGERFAQRLMSAYSPARSWPQLVHIATDGETYGHHHHHGDMALAYALHYIETNRLACLTNYAEFLERFPPTHEVEIAERTAWSCAHGVKRWQSDCGCGAGRPGWSQAWRRPLREALDWLRDSLAPLYERAARAYFHDPWAARDDYIELVLDRSPHAVQRFLARHALRPLDEAEQVAALKLLELQRQAMLMYTSCGWFFEEVTGLETVQVLQYAGRALQLAEEALGASLEPAFLARLEQARSNLPEHRDAARAYRTFVAPARVDLRKVGAHYAISSLFESYDDVARVHCYEVERQDARAWQAGRAKLAVGRVRVTSQITRESATLSFGVLHLGDHNLTCGVRPLDDPQAYEATLHELAEAFGQADLPRVVRLLDEHFQGAIYSLKSLFRDEQRKVLQPILAATLAEAEAVYRQVHDHHAPLMRFLADLGTPLPAALRSAAELVLNADLRRALEADEPDPERVRALLDGARAQAVPLDLPGLALAAAQLAERMAARLQPAAPLGADAPAPLDPPLEVLARLATTAELLRSLPVATDLWKVQNVYWRLLHERYPPAAARARQGDERARAWATHFLALGETLGVRVAEMKTELSAAAPTLASVAEQVLAERRVPTATYRLQFNSGFTFRDAEALVPYLHALGISDCYASPLLQARAGSPHGYDVCDPSRLNAELGTEQDFAALCAALREHGMGLILDTVPNHMGIADDANPWWTDVLENGPGSVYAPFFDIEWQPATPELANKVLLPILSDQFGRVLESGRLRLVRQGGAFYLEHQQTRLPLEPHTYRRILQPALDRLVALLGEDHEHARELRSILTALSYLPEYTERAPERIAERNREKEVIKRRIAALCEACPQAGAAIDASLDAFQGRQGDPNSFDQLNALLDAQPYRPAFWRVAAEEINYRRFFDINELAAIRVERPEVFQATHQLIFRLLAEGHVTGLRIDHPDGLWNPSAYFRQLQHRYLADQVAARLPGLARDERERAVAAWLEAPARWPLYVVAEKILAEGERLPTDWAVDGTTGYDFLNLVNGLFVDTASRDALDGVYRHFTGSRASYDGLVNSSKKMIMLVSLASEINALSHQLERLAKRNRRYRDFTLGSLTFALREVIAALPVYRTYIADSAEAAVSERDRACIERAVAEAKRRNPRTAEAIFDFLRDTLLLRNLRDFREADRPDLVQWVLKVQQVSGPVMAKGVEDTAFYVYNRLVSLNEVGGNPDRFGVSLAEFHHQNAERAHRWPHSLLATSTHDTKRGEDVRARINVLSELPREWQAALARWKRLNARHKTLVDGMLAPDPNDEYLLYQTLVGAWPSKPMSADDYRRFRERIAAYMLKATKEAKVHTSWINANEAYDAAVRSFVLEVLPEGGESPFLSHLQAFQRRVAFFGRCNSLAQVLLKITAPGVPDFYQGTELWDDNLVDPDNRRPVDYQRRRAALAALRERLEQLEAAPPATSAPLPRAAAEATASSPLPAAAARTQDPSESPPPSGGLAALAQELLRSAEDGRVKLYLTHRALSFRRAHARLFAEGAYLPLEASGAKREHVCAFARRLGDEQVLVVAPRLVARLTGGLEQLPLGERVWQDTWLPLADEQPGRAYRDVLTGAMLCVGQRDATPGLPLAAVLAAFPVALLERAEPGAAADSADG